MKKICFLMLIISALVFGQQEKESQSIELPDFVITGVQSVDLPTASKAKAELIPTLSKDFFLPRYTPEELPVANIDNPMSKKFNLWNDQKYYDGSLYIGIGGYTLPEGNLFLGKDFGNYLLSFNVYGRNIKDYVPNSDYNISGGSISNEFYVSDNSDFLPGMQIYLNGNFFRNDYKFFGSPVPTSERRTNNGYAEFGLRNTSGRYLNYDFGVCGSGLTIDQNGFKEFKYSGKGSIELKFPRISFVADASYTKQQLQNNPSGNNSYYFYILNPSVKVALINDLDFEAGLQYSQTNSNSFLAPWGNLKLRLSNSLTFIASYKPHALFRTHRDFILKNIYYDLGTTDNIFTKYKSDLSGGLRYQYYKYIEIGVTGGLAKIDNYFYFGDVLQPGMFDITTANDVTKIYSKLDLLFHPGPMGKLYAEAVYQKTTDSSDRYIPFTPQLKASMSYSYSFPFGINFQAKYDLAFDYYSDIANSNKLPTYHNISLILGYNFVNSLELQCQLQNILNRDNFLWSNYQEKPFDIIVGINYKW